MATALTQEELIRQAAQEAANLLKSQAADNTQTSDAIAKTLTVQSPASVQNTYYPTQSTDGAYESGRPVYEQSDAVKKAAQQLADYQTTKPGGYQSQYGTQIQDLLSKALERKSFSYDPGSDLLYNALMDRSQTQGKQAMRDTMGQAAALTGGYGNSYAQAAGQQAYQQQIAATNDMLPELQAAAREMYDAEGTETTNNLSLLTSLEQSDYGRYRDTVTDYLTELNFLYQTASDMTEAEYNRYLNDVNAWETDRSYYYQKAQDDYTKAQAAKKSSGGNGTKKATATTLTNPTYEQYVAVTGDKAALSQQEFMRLKNMNTKPFAGISTYTDYLKARLAQMN